MDVFEVAMPTNLENLSLPDPGLLSLYECLEDRILWVDREIDDSLLESSKKIMRWNAEDEDKDIPLDKRVPIKVYLFSVGGDLAVTMHLCTMIQMSKTPVITVNMGMAMSGACLILMAGHEGMRYTMPYARALIHTGAGGATGTYDQVTEAVLDYRDQVGAMKQFVLSHTAITPQQYSKKKKSDWYLGAEDMVKFGVVDKVVNRLDEIL